MNEHRTAERAALELGIERLGGVLRVRGFEYSSGEEAASSAGPFAVGVFRRAELEIGLIVRNGNALGCPNYSRGRGYAGHNHLIWALGAEGKEQLVPGDWVSFRARTGGDPFDALRNDLVSIVLPALDASELDFLASLSRAVDKGRATLGLPPQSSG